MAMPKPIGNEWKVGNTTELAILGVRYRVRRDALTAGSSVDISISTGPQEHLVLHIPRPDPQAWEQRYSPRFSTRGMLEALITQLNAQLAVEALEGR